jgi:hypothetical protein
MELALIMHPGYSSRDHILKIQKMTGGMVLVAAHKKPCIADLRFFDDVKPGGNFKIKYFETSAKLF